MEEIDAPHKWQTYAWSGGKVSRKARFLQCRNGVNLAGGSNDLNIAWGDPGCWITPADTSMPEMSPLKRGSKGWQVSVRQSLLAREGHHTNGIDGDFGPGTDGAVRECQAASGLDVDGIVGPTTWQALTQPAIDVAALKRRIAELEAQLAEREADIKHIKAFVESV
jgi:hypothetical protein